jgi:hexulose-6-phosphate isomerase
VPAVVNGNVGYADAWKRSQENIRKAIPYAAEHGIKIAIENVWNKFLLSPLEMAKYIDEFESPWVGSHFDIGNVVEYGYPQDWIRTLGKRILKTDVKEYKSRKFINEMGQGDINWPEVRKALAEIGYKGYCCAEIAAGDEAYLTDVSARMDKCLGIK